jgi:hypothetical protein
MLALFVKGWNTIPKHYKEMAFKPSISKMSIFWEKGSSYKKKILFLSGIGSNIQRQEFHKTAFQLCLKATC